MFFVGLFGQWRVFKSIVAKLVNIDMSGAILDNFVFVDGFVSMSLKGFQMR